MQSERSPYTESLQQLIDKCHHFRDIGHQDSVAALTLPYLKGSLAAQDSLGVQVNFWLRAQTVMTLRTFPPTSERIHPKTSSHLY